MVLISKATGTKYFTVAEAEKLSKQIEKIVKRMGLKVHVGFHPTYLEVPIKEGE